MSKKRSIIPNFLTMSNMIMGFVAIVFASRGDTDSLAVAGILVFVGSFFDLTDGAIARALNVAGPIGIELDSLADAVTYGIAPGIIAYNTYLKELPYIGYGIDVGLIIALIFPVCAVYRLAKFNIAEKSAGFTGLPSPAAGILISVIPGLSINQLEFLGDFTYSMPLELFVPVYIIVGLLMVSAFDYNKLFSDLARKGKVIIIVAVIIIAVLLLAFKMWAVFVVTCLYTLIGIIRYGIKLIQKIA